MPLCDADTDTKLIYFLMLYDQWKFAFISMNRPDYLQDSDVVSARFQVNYCLFPTGFSSCAHKFVVFYDLQSFLF